MRRCSCGAIEGKRVVIPSHFFWRWYSIESHSSLSGASTIFCWTVSSVHFGWGGVAMSDGLGVAAQADAPVAPPEFDVREPLEMLTDEIAGCLRYHQSLFGGRRVDLPRRARGAGAGARVVLLLAATASDRQREHHSRRRAHCGHER